MSRRLVSTCLTHAAALLVGWGGWTVVRHFSEQKTASATAALNAREKRASRAESVDEIFHTFAAKAAAQTAADEERDWPRMDDGLRDEFAQAIAVTPVAGDFEAALAAEMAKMKDGETPSMKMGALLYQWALADPLALLDWRGYEDGARGKVLWFYEDEIFRKLIAERGLASLVPVLKHVPGGDFTTRTIARVFAKSADVTALGNLKQLSGDGWQRVRFEEIGELWPWAERTKLVNFAIAEGGVEMLAKFATTKAAKAGGVGAWLLQLLHDESIGASFREKLAQDDVLMAIGLCDRTLPLDDRAAFFKKGNPAVAGKMEYSEFAWRDVEDILNRERDWNYEFRHGAVEAPEVLAAISKAMPELAAREPEMLRKQVFSILIEEDPARAMRLLDALPPDERARTILHSAKGKFYQTDPNLLLATLQQLAADDPQYRDSRQETWNMTTVWNYQDYDASYVDWVRGLPEGTDREMALHALAKAAVKEKNPSLAAQLREEMKPGTWEEKPAE